VHRVHHDLTVRAGADATADAFGATDIKYEDPESPDKKQLDALFPERTDVAVGVWTDAVVQASPDVEVTPGVRVDLFKSRSATAVGVDPRIAARFRVTDAVRILHAYGLVHQPPSFVGAIPGLVPGTLDEGLQTSFQTSAGVEIDLPEAVTASATLFHNAFFNMTDALGTSADLDVIASERSQGSAAGLELLVKRAISKRLSGFLSYTLSRSIRSLGREKIPSAFDRTHVANAALGYDLGRNWRAGTRVVFYTGAPKFYPANGLIVAPRPKTPERSPAFYRVDVRLEKRWKLGERSWISFVLEVLNTTLNKETFSSAFGGDEEIGPVTIPSVGVEAGF
jgi:hypothetical protein